MIAEHDLARLEQFASVVIETVNEFGGEHEPASNDGTLRRVQELAARSDALIVAPGSPRVDEAILDGAHRLRFIGELEGDRFYTRVDVAAATARGITLVDTTHGSSYPVAEWALALAILGLRDAGRLIRPTDGDAVRPTGPRWAPKLTNRELTGRSVGLVGCGHIAWRLVELLRPFQVAVSAHDPYAPRELASALGVTFGPLKTIFATSDAVFCLAPLTQATRGLIRREHLELLADGSVFINVSRGPVVDKADLEDVAAEGRIVFCLDVFDPEPVPADDPLRGLPNVLFTPHIAGVTDDSRQRFFALMVDELKRHFEGFEPRDRTTARTLAARRGATPPLVVPDHRESAS